MAAAMGIGIGRAVDAVGTSYWWILAAAVTSTLDSTLVAKSGTMDIAAAVGTSNRRAIDAVGNIVDVVGTSVGLGMICIFNNYRLRIKIFVNIMHTTKNLLIHDDSILS
jgi:hypothetical protein